MAGQRRIPQHSEGASPLHPRVRRHQEPAEVATSHINVKPLPGGGLLQFSTLWNART
jgi:hypothetical protein